MAKQKLNQDIYKEIRPYTDEEIPYAINRMLQSKGFITSLTNFLPDVPINVLIKKVRKIRTTEQMQKEILIEICRTFKERSIDNFSVSGFGKLDPNKAYLYIANHRDIIMHSALLQIFLTDNDLKICRSCIGDNLLTAPIFTDIAKCGNMFTITRTGSARQILANSNLVSNYIRKSICEDKCSVWLAQRNGRTKDGYDKTQQSVLKMLYSSKKNVDIYDSIRELNIVPVTISYEFEPCDQMKARELILKEKMKKYVKLPDEDFKSIMTGIFSYKGRVHLQFGRIINEQIDESLSFSCDNDKIQYVCSLIDKQMYSNYRLWPNNHIAYDILNNTTEFQNYYSEFSKRDFNQHIKKQSNVDDVSYFKMKQKLLEIYANPVKAFLENK